MKNIVILNIFLCISISFLIHCCTKEPEKIPFDYDPNFDYASVLKSSPGYAYESTYDYPEFAYQDSSDENLVELKNTYNLKNVADDGDELSKIFNLLKWVHQTIKHDGGNSGPDPENSMNILQYCQETGNGVNCVMMAIVLNEAYLSMGFKSRVVHGNSRDWVFNGDWHAFNMVYSYSLGKWLFIDPTYQAYFTDNIDNILSIAEIREYIIKNKPIILNDFADYNGQTVNVNDYLNYLSKNFYRFSCCMNSSFGNYWIFHGPIMNRNYVHLDPNNDMQKGLAEATNYFTSNPDYYWSKP